MPLDAIDEDTITTDQQAQTESQYAAERQKSRIKQMVEQKKKQVQEVAKTLVKKQVKSMVRRAIINALIAIFGDPWTYIILAAIALIVLGYACAEDVIQCAQVVGLEGLIKAVNLVT